MRTASIFLLLVFSFFASAQDYANPSLYLQPGLQTTITNQEFKNIIETKLKKRIPELGTSEMPGFGKRNIILLNLRAAQR